MSADRIRVSAIRALVAIGALLTGLTVLVGPSASNVGAATLGIANSVLAFGSALNAVGNETGLSGPIAAIASMPNGSGYWTTTASGAVDSEGDAPEIGSLATAPNAPVVGMASTPTGNGYWLVGSDGGIFSFGDAAFRGSTGSMVLNQPIVGMASTPSGNGYWLVASDGGIFAFGDAPFLGSTGAMTLDAPVVGMAATPDGRGYWLVGSDGGVFAFGDARFLGSMGGTNLNAPIVALAATPDGGGYWMVGSDGGIFSFGDAPFAGSAEANPVTSPVVGIAARNGGYWVAYGAAEPLNTVLGQQEALANLGYLPLTWSGHDFQWRWVPPPTLAALWQPGQDNVMTQGAIRAFESVAGLPTDGNISPPEIADLQAAAQDPSAHVNPNGYSYAVATEELPETLTIWHNGQVVELTPANTGGYGTPTAKGTFPVYLRLRNQVMRGVNPDGRSYADPVQFVAYFNGGDALHYMPRASYGDPQSLGCVELPYTAASVVWPYMVIGSLVTVS